MTNPEVSELLELAKAIEPLIAAARGLSHGTDWNNGSAAELHGYRRKLIFAIPKAEAALKALRARSEIMTVRP